jgi:hypothetical protein
MSDENPDRVAPSSQGTYAIFEPPDGSVHLVYRPAGAEEDQHMHFPPAMVKLAKRAAAGESILPGPLGKIMAGKLAKGR